jgi:hypothetical protein
MAWTESSVGLYNDFQSAYEALILPDSGGASVTHIESSNIEWDINDQKFLVTVEMTEACAGNGSLKVSLQGSHDGTLNWTNVSADFVSGLNTTGLNSSSVFVSTVDYKCPYYRFYVYSDGTDTQDAATVKITYSAKVR